MNEEERQALEAQIHEEIKRLEIEIERLQENIQPVAPDNAIGRLTRMEAINSKSINEANLGKAKKHIQRLNLALGRMDDEDFGICLSCERPIPIKRLMIVPESTHCVRCLSR